MSLGQPQWADVQFRRVEDISEHSEGIVLICREEVEIPKSMVTRCVDLIKELASQKNKEFEEAER